MSADVPGIESLKAQARAAGPAALARLGRQLLVGEGVAPAPPQAVAILEEAAQGGEGDASALLSVCAAWGVGRTRDFVRALHHLERAAEQGVDLARRELQLLSGDSAGDWSALRQRIDLAALSTPPAGRTVRDRPRVIVIERFMSAAECEWVIALGRPALHRARVYQSSASARVADSRTNREASFTIFHADLALAVLRERMSHATRASTSYFEVAKLLHYEPGQQFALHADFLQTNTPELAREVERRGQRAATLLVYLNEGYEGGETDFPRIGFRFKGRRGDALIFSNIDPSGAPDYDTMHAGLPPTSGEKWVLSQWIRTRPMVA